jgi:hypothetical protein
MRGASQELRWIRNRIGLGCPEAQMDPGSVRPVARGRPVDTGSGVNRAIDLPLGRRAADPAGLRGTPYRSVCGSILADREPDPIRSRIQWGFREASVAGKAVSIPLWFSPSWPVFPSRRFRRSPPRPFAVLWLLVATPDGSFSGAGLIADLVVPSAFTGHVGDGPRARCRHGSRALPEPACLPEALHRAPGLEEDVRRVLRPRRSGLTEGAAPPRVPGARPCLVLL